MHVLTGQFTSLACKAPDFNQSVVGPRHQVEAGGRETNGGHVSEIKAINMSQIALQ